MHFPDSVTVVEVGPRDGLQALPRWVDTADKIRAIDRLSACGLAVIEAASFASPKAVPMLADGDAVLAGITRRPGTVYRALAPNMRGLQRALAAGADEVVALTTVSVEYTRRNQNMTVEEATDTAAHVYVDATSAGRSAVVAVGMALWCPFDGAIPPEHTVAVVRRLHAAGVRRLYIAGSLGMEDPRLVGRVISELLSTWPDLEVGFHAHDLAGFAAANVLAALDAGATFIESSVAGLGGGTVYSRHLAHAGNLPTEDLVHLLDVCGVRTGLDVEAVSAAAADVSKILGVEPVSRVTDAGTRDRVRAWALT